MLWLRQLLVSYLQYTNTTASRTLYTKEIHLHQRKKFWYLFINISLFKRLIYQTTSFKVILPMNCCNWRQIHLCIRLKFHEYTYITQGFCGFIARILQKGLQTMLLQLNTWKTKLCFLKKVFIAGTKILRKTRDVNYLSIVHIVEVLTEI